MKAPPWLLVLLLTPLMLGAQQVVAGDSVRVRQWSAAAWQVGRASAISLDTIWIRTGLQQPAAVPMATVQRLDRWERRTAWQEIGSATAAGIFAGAGLYHWRPKHERRGDWATYSLIGGVSGAALGALSVAIKAGLWKSVIRR